MSARDYKIVPSQDELSSLERDLRFHAASSYPKCLTDEQVKQFNRDGFIKSLDLFSVAEMVDVRDYFDGLLQRTLAEGGDSYSISSAHLRHSRVYDMLKDGRIVDLVADLLGEDVVAWGSHFFCKMPHDGKSVAWHQDASYWPLTPSKAVTVWLAIDDADQENACMRFVAGSHHFGHLTYRPSNSSDHNVLTQTIENPAQYGQIVDDDLKAGQISISQRSVVARIGIERIGSAPVRPDAPLLCG